MLIRLFYILFMCVCPFYVNALQSPLANKFYLGADVQFIIPHDHQNEEGILINKYKYTFGNGQLLRRVIPGVGIKAGYRWNTLGVEIGYDSIGDVVDATTSPNIAYYYVNRKINNIYIDEYFFLPVNRIFELKAMLGFGLANASISGHGYITSASGNISSAGKVTSNQISPRIGAGIQFNIFDRFSLDVMYRCQGGNNLYKYYDSVGLGLSYHF